MKKTIIFILTICMTFVCFVGCQGKNNENDNKDSSGNVVTDVSKILDINVWNSGYGTKWVKQIAEAFKKVNPGVAVNVRAKPDQGDFYNTIESGASANDTDLYFTYGPKFLKFVNGKNSSNKLLEPLDDVLSYRAEGESKTIGEKFNKSVLESLQTTENDKTVTYALSFNSSCGSIVYKSKKFKELNLSVPRTTDELIDLIVNITENTDYNGKTPGVGGTPKAAIVHYSGYWQDVLQNWWLQYEGAENFNNHWTFKDIDIKNMSQEKDKYYQEGLVKALQTLYDVITPEGATYEGSNSMVFTDLQSRFLESDIALMYPCGSWLETEMEKTEDFDKKVLDEVEMMKTPVLSAIAKKLTVGHRKDSDLIAVIDYVDGKGEKPAWASEEDVNLVRFSRNATCGQYSSSTAVVPSYSPAKELAKKFLQFLYSDEGLKIFAETMKNILPVSFDNEEILDNIDKSNWNSYSKSCYNISCSSNRVAINLNHPMYYNTSLTELFSNTPEFVFTNSSPSARKDVDGFLAQEWTSLMSNWSVLVESAGL